MDPRTANADDDRWSRPDLPAAAVSFDVSDNAGLSSGAAIPIYGRG